MRLKYPIIPLNDMELLIKKWYTKIRFKITHAALQINSPIIIPQQGKTAKILIITVIPQ